MSCSHCVSVFLSSVCCNNLSVDRILCKFCPEANQMGECNVQLSMLGISACTAIIEKQGNEER